MLQNSVPGPAHPGDFHDWLSLLLQDAARYDRRPHVERLSAPILRTFYEWRVAPRIVDLLLHCESVPADHEVGT
jgi:hypothetical protein